MIDIIKYHNRYADKKTKYHNCLLTDFLEALVIEHYPIVCADVPIKLYHYRIVDNSHHQK